MDYTERILQPKDGPVVPELEALEVIFAKDQPEYHPLRALRSAGPQGHVLTRWSLNDHQKAEVAMGADIFLILNTFGKPLQPIQIVVAHELDAQSVAEVFDITVPDKALPKES